ncbi:MAG: hypothetical protein LBS59_04165 [Puniceicoccales bacterium]|jgi:opacity protein-like surface antigen|nr:hypothetical protein [Puniceicoccales bacterium]
MKAFQTPVSGTTIVSPARVCGGGFSRWWATGVLLAMLAAPLACGAAAEEPAKLPVHGIAPLPEGAAGRWLSQPKTKHLHLDFSAAWVYHLGEDVRGHEGWGGVLTFLLMPERSPEYPNWQLKFGGDLFVFHATRSYVNSRRFSAKDSIDAGALTVVGGASYTFQDRVELGVLLGLGLAGTYGETRAGGDTDRNGNVNLSMHVKPSLTFHITDNLSLSGVYRFGFITPVVRADLVDYRSVDIVHQSVEVALTLRF